MAKKDSNSKKKWKDKKNTYKYYSLIAKPATQVINMGIEAYEYMVSKECPSWIKPKIWLNMDKTQRLESHLRRICEHLKGKSFSYEVLED